MNNERKINLHMFGLIYFVLFVIPIALNKQNAFLKFPKLDENFQLRMIIDIGLGAAIGLLIVLISWMLTKFTKIFQELVEVLNSMLGPLTVLEIFFIAAFSSIAEEFFFRGLVQEKLGIVIATVLFGLLHSGPGKKFLPWTAFALVMGALMGGVYEWRQNLMAPIMIHFVANFVNLILMQRLTSSKKEAQ